MARLHSCATLRNPTTTGSASSSRAPAATATRSETAGRPWGWLGLIALAVAGLGGVWVVRGGAVDDPDRLWKQAELDFQAGRYDRAASALARLERVRAPSPLDWMLRAQLALVKKR